jgi:organic radical activating enzyme
MNYERYYSCDVLNGEGLRVTLFVTGCAHACPGCYNPSTWNRLAGQSFTDEVREQILDLCADHDGLSLTGGDPLDAFRAELQEVTRCLANDTASEILNGELAEDAIAICHQDAKSLTTGRPVRIR